MFILRNILTPLQDEFKLSRKGDERGIWFIYTLLAIITHFTSSRTSNLIRCLQTLFGLHLDPHRFYTFMASPKLPWKRLWPVLWTLIPQPTVNGCLLLALDDYINPKTGKKVFGCASFFDHAAKINQCKYPWSQNCLYRIVENGQRSLGLATFFISLLSYEENHRGRERENQQEARCVPI